VVNHGVGSVEKSFVPNTLWRKRVISRRPRRKTTMLIVVAMKQDLLKMLIVAADIIAIVENVGEKLNCCSPNTTNCTFFSNVFTFLYFPLNGF